MLERGLSEATNTDLLFGGLGPQLRMGHALHVLPILNNTALGLFARRGETNLPHAQRRFVYQFDHALAWLAA